MFGEATPCLGKPHPQPKTRNRKTRTRNRLRGLTFKPQYLHLNIPNSRFEPLYQPFQASQMSNPFRNPVSKQSSIRGGGNNAVDTTRAAHPCLLRAGDLAWPYRDQRFVHGFVYFAARLPALSSSLVTVPIELCYNVLQFYKNHN